MCGVFYIDDDMLHEIRSIAQEIDQKLQTGLYTKDIHPSELAPVLIGENNKTKLSLQHWGYPGIQGKGVIFNDRSETVKEGLIESIDLMKKSILAKAFRGELGTNDPSEENALELLKSVL